ncbi:MAG: HvfC family RiPP maturation protein [Lysobacter sp.]
MSPEPAGGAQHELGTYIRDPAAAPPPIGIEERRLKIYRELFFNNIESMLAGNFPVIRKILSAAPDSTRWSTLVRDFYREHPSHTPLFTELAREFVRYLEHRAGPGRGDLPWLPELAHYEWLELALQISEARADDIPHDPDGDLLDGRPLLSPLAWPQTYRWPVHRIAPDCQPDAPPAEPTCLLLQRDSDGKVHFQQLSALTFRLLQRLDQHPDLTGRHQLQALAQEAATEADDAFTAQGLAMLQQLRSTAVIQGTRTD